jgi:hypothetical protein
VKKFASAEEHVLRGMVPYRREERERDVLRDVGLSIDQILPLAISHEMAKCEADRGAEDDAKHDLVYTSH